MDMPIYKADSEGKRIGFNTKFFSSGDKEQLKIEPASTPRPPEAKRRGRPPKNKTLSNGETIIVADDEDNSDLSMIATNAPYLETYNETNNMLKTSIVQIDILNNDIKGELDNIKSSKTLKRKFEYISELTGTSSNLLNTKISAIRELNKTITDSHNLEMKRIKDLKMMNDVKDDDKHIMDMYNAFVSTPMGSYNPLGPNIMDVTIPNGAPQNIVRADMNYSEDAGYNHHLSTMTPEQNRMRMERNPNIKTVVIYNQENGDRRFDVIDTTTGQSIPNMPLPSQFILDDLNINIRAGVARNSNIDADYPLIIVGQGGSMLDY